MPATVGVGRSGADICRKADYHPNKQGLRVFTGRFYRQIEPRFNPWVGKIPKGGNGPGQSSLAGIPKSRGHD